MLLVGGFAVVCAEIEGKKAVGAKAFKIVQKIIATIARLINGIFPKLIKFINFICSFPRFTAKVSPLFI